MENEVGPLGHIRLQWSGNDWYADTKHGLFKLYWPYNTDKETAERVAELACYLYAKKTDAVLNPGKMASDYYYLLKKY